MGEVLDGWRKANVAFKKGQKGDPGTNRLVSLNFSPWEIMERFLLEHISGHMKEKVIRNSQHGFTKSNQPDCLL